MTGVRLFATVLFAFSAACTATPVPVARTLPDVDPQTPRLTTASPSPQAFVGSIAVIDAATLRKMGTSWHPECPVPRHRLRVVRLTHWSFDGTVRIGEMIVHQNVAADVVSAFRKIFAARFPIENMVIANGYDGDDPRLIQHNPTSGFNCRNAVGRSGWSEHAYGLAVDVNPMQNPRVSSGGIVPPEALAYVNRSPMRPGMIVAGSRVVQAFTSIGWRWGGTYRRAKDWHHFSLRGR